MGMRQSQLVLYVFANGLILLASWPIGPLALGFFEAGKSSSFSPLQESSFWTSDAGNYTFGFQAVNGGSTDYLLSIWLSKDPHKTAIWWPHVGSNDGDPTVKEGASFEFTSKGRLELYSPAHTSGPLWTTNTTSAYAKLEDTGNLMLFESKESSAISWQSFAHNQDSLMYLVGLDSINVNNKAILLQSRINQSSYVSGRFKLQIDTENLELHGQDYLGNDYMYADGKMGTRAGFQIGKDKNTYNSSNSSNGVERLTLDYDGNLKIYQWQASNTSWVMAWQLLDNKCRVGSPCGPFGICQSVDADGKVTCSCPTGYHPKVAHDPSQGCENSISFKDNFNSTDIKMEEVPDADYYFNDLDNSSDVTKDDCKQICSNNCACLASVYSQADETCFVKGANTVHYLMNGYKSSGSVLFIKVKITSSKQNWVIIGVYVGVAAAVLVVVGFGAWLTWQRRNNANPILQLGRYKPKQEVPGNAGPVRFYRLDELVTATGNFSEPLGEGGFGTVFKGCLPVKNIGFDNIDTDETLGSNVVDNNQQMRAVAVKVLRDFRHRRSDVDAHDESYSQFKAEINTLGKIHHVNLVHLLGYSYSTTGPHCENARMLVYECMQKGSLDRYLSTSQYAQPKLPWCTRYSIALGIARGMAYLHHDCSPPILHCDIKPHNILLDDNFIAKVADFGFARRVHLHHPYSHIILSSVRGTHGYLAPEWFTSDGITFKVDVYSFGKLLLELVRGFKAADGLSIEWAVKCMSQGAVMEFSKPPDVQADENLIEFVPLPHQGYHNSQLQEANEKLRLLKVGMWCIQHEPSLRPTMSGVVKLIEGATTMEDPPIPPTPLELPSGNESCSTRTYQYSLSLSGR